MKKLIALLPLLALNSVAQADTAYGALGNFDAVNDTGQTCYGFEIEIDDAHSTNIGGTYDWNHYGKPTITEDNTDPLHPKVFVRYQPPAKPDPLYPQATGFTNAAAPGAIAPTQGHQCTNAAVNQGCEHFGVGIYSTSFSTTTAKYHWLIKDGSGNIVTGPAVNVSTPKFNYTPAVIQPPVNNNPPVVQFPAQVVAVIPAPAIPPVVSTKTFGEPSWVKVIKTTTHKANPLILDDLVGDVDANGIPKWRNGIKEVAGDVETEFYLLQSEKTNAAGAVPNPKKTELAGGADKMGDGSEIVTRRYEFYAYVGLPESIDGESGEAMCDTVAADGIYGVPGNVKVTQPDPAIPGDTMKVNTDCSTYPIVGEYKGSQMAEFNGAAPLDLTTSVQNGKVGEAYPDRRLPSGGNTPYNTKVSTGSLPNGLVLDPQTGILSGAPTKVGSFNFTASVTDANGKSASKPLKLNVTGRGDVDTNYQVDVVDLANIKAHNGLPAQAGDPADVNGDLRINILDYRAAALLCTKSRCAQ